MDGPASSSSYSGTSFVVLSVSIIGILTTSLLLLGYYLFITKCGLGWRPQDVATGEQAQRPHRIGPSLPLYSTGVHVRGLAEAAIRQIPTFRYKKGVRAAAAGQRSAHECAVCLSEFQEEERVRLLPGCLHVFHIDCIDTWLQGNANCPLCRSAISADQLDMSILHHHAGRGDAVIQVSDSGDHGHDHELSERKVPIVKMCSMGDECIDARRGEREELFSVQQPMRRSLSMDSCSDKQFYLALQKILQQQQDSTVVGEDGKGEGSSGGRSGRLRRSFFSFTQGRSSRGAILPI